MTKMSRALGLLGAALGVFMACAPATQADPPPPILPATIAPGTPQETAIVAGGCFWGMEKVMRRAPGVLAIEVGYAGGTRTDVGYDEVSDGGTGHAESVRIVFDPTKISYADLLKHWFFRGHDPTTRDRQGNDVGTQYRSAIFATTPQQLATAREVEAAVDKSGKWEHPIVTQVVPATTWVRAEEHHQDYLIKHPHGYDDHYLRSFDF